VSLPRAGARRVFRQAAWAGGGLLVLVLVLLARQGGARAVTPTTHCTTHWTNTAGGDWSVGASWSAGVAPGPTSDVCIDAPGTYTVTVEGSVSVDALVVGTSTTPNPGSQTLQLTDHGCAASSAPNLTTTSTTYNDVISAAGTLDLTSTCSGGNRASFTVSRATLPVVNEGTIRVDAGTGGARTITGPVTNSSGAKVNINAPTSYGSSAGTPTWDNLGALTIADHATLQVTANAGATFIDDSGGTISTTASAATGVFSLQAGNTFTLTGGTTSGNPVVVINATTNFSGSGGVASVWAEGATSILQGTINQGQTYQVEGAGSGGPATTVTLAGNVADNGLLDLNSVGFNGDQDSLVAPAGTTLTVGSAGVLKSDPGTGGPRTLMGAITVNPGGQVNINVGTTWSSGTFTNNGTVNVADGLSFLVPATSPTSTFINGTTGNIATTSNSNHGSLFLVGGVFSEAGTTTGGPVYVEDASLKYRGTGASSVTSWGTTTLGGNLGQGQTLTVQAVGCVTDSNLTVPRNLTVAGSIILTARNCHGANASITMTSAIGRTYLSVAATGSLTWAAGSGGGRTITGKVINDGMVGPDAAYPLSIVGTFTQGSTGTVTTYVSATAAATITTTAAAHLAGNLVAVPVAGFTPAHGASWTGIVKASRIYQIFATTTGPGGTWTSAVASGSVTLTYS
jgi:hypothetical protein